MASFEISTARQMAKVSASHAHLLQDSRGHSGSPWVPNGAGKDHRRSQTHFAAHLSKREQERHAQRHRQQEYERERQRQLAARIASLSGAVGLLEATLTETVSDIEDYMSVTASQRVTIARLLSTCEKLCS
mmetsp:Transcript_52587/g.87285  ORF Transcript_52587/g.87285 Transcript_52587/m.87285 type:complete len:131 (-) Transcript_52587:136-528(-)